MEASLHLKLNLRRGINKRKNSARKTRNKVTIASPEKRQKISESGSSKVAENAIKKTKGAKKTASTKKKVKLTKSKSWNSARTRKASMKQMEDKSLIPLDENITKPAKSGSTGMKEKLKRVQKNPYYGIIDTLPKEIQAKIDWKKENLQDMFKTLTPPHECKPGLVLKWLKRVSENELKNIHAEMYNIRASDRALKRKLFQTFENCEPLTFSNHSQRSDESVRNYRGKIETPAKKKSSYNIINFNGTNGENNSAYSKTSTNTNASPNLVRISTDQERANLKFRNYIQAHTGKVPQILSVDPGKSIVIKFITPATQKEPQIEVKWKKNIFNKEKQPDIFIENLDENKGNLEYLPPKFPSDDLI